MTYFNIDPKPKNYVHPNRIVKIEKVVYGTETKFMAILVDLCSDKTLSIEEGKGVLDLTFKTISGDMDFGKRTCLPQAGRIKYEPINLNLNPLNPYRRIIFTIKIKNGI